jgi:hypothetical protein
MPPSIYSAQITYESSTSSWAPQTPSLVLQGTGVSTGTSTYVPDWGNFVSIALDPANNVEFWGFNEYFTANEKPGALTWATEIFNFAAPPKKTKTTLER